MDLRGILFYLFPYTIQPVTCTSDYLNGCYKISLAKTSQYPRTDYYIRFRSDAEFSKFKKDTKAYRDKVVNDEYCSFLKENADNSTCYLYFQLDDTKKGTEVKYLLQKEAIDYEIVPNLFLDDSSVNIRIEYNDENCDVPYMQYLWHLCDYEYDIYHLQIESFFCVMRGTLVENKRISSDLYIPNYKYRAEITRIWNTLSNEMGIMDSLELYDRYINPMYALICNSRSVSYQKYEKAFDNETFEITLLTEMREKEITFTKWRAELTVYYIVSKRFPDAVYQYHDEWLESMSLDVYVPGINTAIEYQGIQHYQPVVFFGGEECFQEQQRRDKRKKELCDQKGIRLIYWKYDEPITDPYLEKKLESPE